MVLFIYYVTANCGFSVSTSSTICDQIDQAPLKKMTSSSDPNMEKVFEDPGTIVVYHGFGCSKSDKSGRQDILKVEQSRDIARYANATVFLNGWHLTYHNGNQDVAGLATIIRNIRLEEGTLKWEAVGLLSDDNFDNPYDWCYYFTVVAWNPAKIDLLVDHKDGDCVSHNPSDVNFFFAGNKGTTTALSSFPTILQNTVFEDKKTVTILPRGFGFKWGYGNSYSDHHLLQIGYNLEHGEIFNEKKKNYQKGMRGTTTSGDDFSFVDTGYVSWETYAILKDNDGRRDYEFGEMVSELGGNDLGVIQPPFSILPVEDVPWYDFTTCLPGSGIDTKEFEIQNVPYKYAIPVLTGWELEYGCDDQKVKEIGIWIDKMDYDPVNPGRLHYTLSSILRDDDTQPYFLSKHKVNVLGIKPAPGSGKAAKGD
jgi:hypothetical protein